MPNQKVQEKEPGHCQKACPSGMDVPTDEALGLIRWDNPLPAVCGRVCPHECEYKCKRGTVDTPVCICAMRRFVMDYARLGRVDVIPEKEPARSEKIAVVGSGPAGLTVAHDIALWGYNVTIFEALPEAGGMLRAGIPEYRLPRDETPEKLLTTAKKVIN